MPSAKTEKVTPELSPPYSNPFGPQTSNQASLSVPQVAEVEWINVAAVPFLDPAKIPLVVASVPVDIKVPAIQVELSELPTYNAVSQPVAPI